MASDEYPYLAQLSVPDRLRLAAYEASAHGVPAIHLRVILDASRFQTGEEAMKWLLETTGRLLRVLAPDPEARAELLDAGQ